MKLINTLPEHDLLKLISVYVPVISSMLIDKQRPATSGWKPNGHVKL